MALPDISNLTSDELLALFQAANAAYHAKEAEAAADAETRRAQIYAAIASLEALLGQHDGTPGTDSIRDVLQYDDATMAANAGLAFRLAFTGLEQLTATLLNIAHVVAREAH